MMNMMKVYDLIDDGFGVNYYDYRGIISIYIKYFDCQFDYCFVFNCIIDQSMIFLLFIILQYVVNFYVYLVGEKRKSFLIIIEGV